MALRSEATIGILIMACAMAAGAAEFPVRHVHLKKDQPGTLTIGKDGIRFAEQAGKHPHVYEWPWTRIQRLELSPARVTITTYEDVRWQAGRDRGFRFTGQGLDAAYPLLREHLPRRFVPDVARMDFEAGARYPAKRLEGRSGHEGVLLAGADRLVFQSESANGSHTWIVSEIDNISSSDPMKLTILSLGTDYELQLKQPMPEADYNALWRKLNVRSKH